MIYSIFPPNNFYSHISAPNKEELIDGLRRAKVDPGVDISWNKDCDVKVDPLYNDEVREFFTPTLEIFFNEFKKNIPIKLNSVWRNTYTKGGFQEIHDHFEGADVSGCVFLEDFNPDAGKFYFYNRHASEINVKWRHLIVGDDLIGMLSKVIAHSAGDVLLFPSYVLHGVTPHKLRRPRTTVSFNMSFV